ncbi:hypothetical protein GGR57DRAFT_518931 [Xylariaceae sp. FL1272]|nr:hypothetical protein GGR57DRAFT_518931 [Xylariaceae sp. FL1272]
MVIFVDLDDEADPPQNFFEYGDLIGDRTKHLHQQELAAIGVCDPVVPETREKDEVVEVEERENPNRNRMTEALGCYPIVTAIVSSLDLNTLDNLSRTCRQIREGLLQYRTTLVTRTLHCYKETPPLDPEDNEMNWYYMSINESYRRSKTCARDMVLECRRCSRAVCRNCTIRPPGPSSLKARHRRLCVPCAKAPLVSLTRGYLHPNTPVNSDEMQRAVCQCASDRVWLCQPCGRNIIGADQDYRSIWRWRNQYGEVLGGVGMGEGDRGVICGREATCLSSKALEQETDCDAHDSRSLHSNLSSSPPTPSPSSSLTLSSPLGSLSSLHSHGSGYASGSSDSLPRTPSPGLGNLGLRPGYARHEIEGIGGRVKTLHVNMVRVGACVPEWEDEKAKGQILEREVSGQRRSWCGWCWRVIAAGKDLGQKTGEGKVSEGKLMKK